MVKSVSRGVMRATPMSMFFSRERATASSIERSTRGPSVLNCFDGVGACVACVCSNSARACAGFSSTPSGPLCASAGLAGSAANRTAAAVTTTFFFTRSSNTSGMGTELTRTATAVTRLREHRLDLRALFRRQHFVHPVQHERAPLVQLGARALDLFDLRDDGCFVGGVLNHLRQGVFQLIETAPGIMKFRRGLLPDFVDRLGLLIRYAQLRPKLRIDPPLRTWLVPLVGLTVPLRVRLRSTLL